MSSPRLTLRLYVAGDGPNSRLARDNLARLCPETPTAPYSVEIIDVFEQPRRALDDGVLLTPALIIRSGDSGSTLIGTLGRPEVLLQALDEAARAA